MASETFTNGQLFNLQGSLQELSKLNIPARVGIRVARFVRLIHQEIEPIQQERNKLFVHYGEKTPTGYHINPDMPGWPAFFEEHESLMSQTIKVEFEPLLLPEDVSLTVATLVALEPFLVLEGAPGDDHRGKVDAIRVAK